MTTIIRAIPDAYSVQIQRMGTVRTRGYRNRHQALLAAHGVCLADENAWAIVETVPGGWLAVDGNRMVIVGDEAISCL